MPGSSKPVSATEQQEALDRFLAAIRHGDLQGLLDVLAPDVVVPAHCTGWKAAAAVAARLPEAFIQNTVGTRFDLEAA